MKSNLRLWAMLTASAFGLLVAAAGCGAQEVEDPITTDQQAVISTDEEAVTSDESALSQVRPAQKLYRGRCWIRMNCKGQRLPSLLTRVQCRSRKGHSWRSFSPPGKCINIL